MLWAWANTGYSYASELNLTIYICTHCLRSIGGARPYMILKLSIGEAPSLSMWGSLGHFSDILIIFLLFLSWNIRAPKDQTWEPQYLWSSDIHVWAAQFVACATLNCACFTRLGSLRIIALGAIMRRHQDKRYGEACTGRGMPRSQQFEVEFGLHTHLPYNA